MYRLDMLTRQNNTQYLPAFATRLAIARKTFIRFNFRESINCYKPLSYERISLL